MMRAVEKAMRKIAPDCEESQRQLLILAIWDSCDLGRNFKIEYYDIPVGKTNFYEYRKRFLYEIALDLGFL